MTRDFLKAREKILKAGSVVVAGHINPDGDSIGSLLALGLALEGLGKRVYMVSRDGVPYRYRLLPGADRIIKHTQAKCDLAISVDCSNKEILGKSYEIFKRAENILEIDHHEFRRPFGDISIIDTKAAAVGEIIYSLLNSIKGTDINSNVAQNILTSIIVETNSFRLPGVRPLTFEICARLLEIVDDFSKLTDMVYWIRRRASVILSGICLSRCRFLKGDKVAWSIVRQEDFRKARGRDEDVDAVAGEMISISDVKIAVLFREKDGKSLRVSLRSKGAINVASLAEAYGGGGHFDIAGCSIPNNRASINRLLKMSEKLL